ncbi:MAG: hypothetical protein ACK4HS_11855, partial [Acinetobacter junii]
NLDIFKTYQPTQESNYFSQILVSQQVFIRITADGCAFYSISVWLQYLSKKNLFNRTLFRLNSNFLSFRFSIKNFF